MKCYQVCAENKRKKGTKNRDEGGNCPLWVGLGFSVLSLPGPSQTSPFLYLSYITKTPSGHDVTRPQWRLTPGFWWTHSSKKHKSDSYTSLQARAEEKKHSKQNKQDK